MIKKIFKFIFEPFMFVKYKKTSEKIAEFFTKYNLLIYIIAFLITFLIFYLFNAFDFIFSSK